MSLRCRNDVGMCESHKHAKFSRVKPSRHINFILMLIFSQNCVLTIIRRLQNSFLIVPNLLSESHYGSKLII